MCGVTSSGHDVGGYSDFATYRISRSRRDRRCEICQHAIRKGSFYVRVFQKFEGDVSGSNMHLQCRALADRTAESGESFYYDDLLDGIEVPQHRHGHVAVTLFGQGDEWQPYEGDDEQ